MKASQDHLTEIAELRAANQALEAEIRALRASEKDLLQAAAMTHVGHWEWDIPNDQIHWSDEVYRIYGIDPRTEMNYDTLLAAIHPEDRDYHNERTAAWIEERGGDPFEYRVVRPDGSIRYIYARGRVVCDDAGEPVRFMGTLQDMTQLKLAQETVRESESRFRATFEQAAVGFAHVALDGRFLRLNQRYCEIVGYSADEMQQLTFQDITHPDDLEADLAYVQALLAGQLATYSMEKRYIHKDGESVWVNLTVSLLRDTRGEPEYFIAVVEDICERKAMEQALSESELKYRSIVEQTVEGILVVQGGERKYYNPAWLETLGLSAEVYDSTSFLSFVHPDDLETVAALVQDFTARGTFAPVPDFRIVASSGDVKWISLRGTKIEWEGEPAGALFIHDITRRKQADIRLQTSEARFRATFEQAAVGIAHVALDGNFLRLNERFCEIVGYAHHEMQSLTFQDITHPDDLETDLAHVQELLAGQRATYSMEKRYIRKGGDIVWVNLTVSLSLTETDQPDFFIAVIEDITERKRAAEELRLSEQRFSTLFEQAAMGIALVDQRGHPIISNPALQRLLGYSDEELRGMAFREFTHPDDVVIDVALFNELLANLRNDYQIEKRYLTKDGRTVWVRLTVSIVRDKEGGQQFVIGMAEDITERKRIEQALNESELKYRTVVEQATEGIIVVQDFERRYFNPAFREMTGYPEEEYRAKPFMELIHPDDIGLVRELYEALMSNSRAKISSEFRMITKSDEIRWLAIQGRTIEWEGKAAGMVFAKDITEQKYWEQKTQFYQRQLKALASQLTLGEEQERRRIAVELHDQVGQALAFSRVQIAAAKKAKSSAQRNAMLDETTEILKETIQETRSLVFDLSSPLLHELGLNAAISEWMNERLEKQAGLKTELIEIGPEWRPSADLRAVVFRSVRELLTNVIRHARATHVTVTLEQSDTQYCIVIRDDGIGFEPEAIVPGLSRSGGFGLFSIQERLSNLGGSWTIQSAPGEGTEITLCLPTQAQ